MDTRIVVNRPLTEDDFEMAPKPEPSVHKLDDSANLWHPANFDNSGADYVHG